MRITRIGRLAWLALGAGLCACDAPVATDRPTPTPANAHAAIVAHSAEFERRVHEVVPGVYQAVGFGLANSMLVEGDQCAFVIDVMGSVETARTVRDAFAKLTQKPIRAFIYTHNHADHVFGGAGFDAGADVTVYAHATTETYINRVVNILRPIISERSARMFGTDLPAQGPDAVINAGIGPFLELRSDSGSVGLVRPTTTFDTELATTICGVDVHLQHAPGETNDQIFVWLPERKLLFPGDNIYKAFPNLYTIRGTPHRDVLKWVASLDAMRALAPEHLVPSHTRYLSGAQEIAETLIAYRDAIQFVHDQTVRGMNQGLTPDELVDVVRLPPHLAEHPYLQELYGTVAWSVRAIFNGYLGWYDGDPAHLEPSGTTPRAAAMTELAGGRDALLDAARKSLDEGAFSFAAELAGYALRLNEDDDAARILRHDALRELAARSTSPNGRHYYLVSALETDGRLTVSGAGTIDERVRALVYSIPIENFMAAMPTRLNARAAVDEDTRVGFRFTDVDQGFTLHVRGGVAEFRDALPATADIMVTTSAQTWREIVVGERALPVALASGELEVDGGVTRLVRFLRLFQ